MKNKIKRFAKGDFHIPQPEIIFPETRITMRVGEGEKYRGSFSVIWKSRREKKLPVCVWRWRRRIQELCPSMKGLDMRCWITCRWSKMRHNRRNAYMYTI